MGVRVQLELPPCMAEAWELIEQDRAFVACLVLEDEVRTVASEGTVTQLQQLPQALQFLSPDASDYTRASFLLCGVIEVSTPRVEPDK